MKVAAAQAQANLFVVDHPLVAHKLTILRDKNTDSAVFRRIAHEITLVLGVAATQNLVTKNITIETPLAPMESPLLIDDHPVIVPILRAGLGMLDAMLTLIPTARAGHIGMARNEDTLETECYYFRIPENSEHSPYIMCDPMLATGGSAIAAIDHLKAAGIKNIVFVGILAAKEGVRRLTEKHPDVPIYIAAVDDKLNEHAYIVPGLGDAGDRISGTV